jgi:hypothetical protein
MANVIKLKRSGTASTSPTSLEHGELAINYADGKLYYKNSSNSIVQFLAPSVVASSYVAAGKLSSDQTIASNTNDVLISFVDDLDPNNWWNATTKQFTPTIAGYYNVSLHAWWTAAGVTTNQYNIQIRKNGSTFAIFQNQTVTGSGSSQGGSRIVYLNGSTDYVDFTAYNGDSSTRSLQWGGAGQGTWFSASLVTAGKGDKGDTGETGATGATGPAGSVNIAIDGGSAATIYSYDGVDEIDGGDA